MSKTVEDIQSYLVQLNLSYDEPRKDTLIVRGIPGVDAVVISMIDTVVVFRVKVMDIPKKERESLYKKLLELNATEMLHGAYGIEGNFIIISDALQLENLDYNEFAATLDDISLALSSHRKYLEEFREKI